MLRYVITYIVTIIKNIGIAFYNLLHPRRKKEYIKAPSRPDFSGGGPFTPIDMADLYEAGEQSTTGGGGAASYTSGREITINMEINTDVIVGDRREMAIWIAEEIKEALDLGLVI